MSERLAKISIFAMLLVATFFVAEAIGWHRGYNDGFRSFFVGIKP